jgi:hypothetical protein
MPLLSRRTFALSAGASLVLAPFVDHLFSRRRAHAATGRARRLLLFCTMGTNPDLWKPTGVSGESSFTFSDMTAPLAAIKDNLVMIDGLISGNPADGHGAPDGLTGVGFALSGSPACISVDQFVSDRLKASGVNSAIPTLLLGAATNASGGRTMFNRGGSNLSTINSPLSAFTTVFNGVSASSGGPPPDALLARRKSILDLLQGEITGLQAQVGSAARARLDLHLTSIRDIENRLTHGAGGAGGCTMPATPSNDTSDVLAADLTHLDLIVSAFACDITRVAALELGSDQSLPVNLPSAGLQGDQHGGFLHSGAPDFKNLIKFEAWMAQRFVDVVNKLKTVPEADGSGTLFDNTLVAWCRDMGDAVNHNQQSMRFVLAGGAGGYLKTNPNGRYMKLNSSPPAERHERVLLNLCEAMGVTSFTGFGDPQLPATYKTPLPGVAA